MGKTTPGSMSKSDFRAALGLALFFVITAIVLFVFGWVKSNEFEKTEKIKMTFTEPVVSVSRHRDSDGDDEYRVRIYYVYKGETRTYTFTSSRKYAVGEKVTFTKYFTPAGTEVKDYGKYLNYGGFFCLFLSLPWVILTVPEIRIRIKTKSL